MILKLKINTVVEKRGNLSRKISNIKGFITKKGVVYDPNIANRAYNPNKKVKLIKKNKEIHEQSLNELLKNDDSIYYTNVEPNSMTDYNFKKGDFKYLSTLKKSNFDKSDNNYLIKIDKNSTKSFELKDKKFEDLTQLDIDKIQSDGFNSVKVNDTIHLLKNFDRKNIKKFDYKKEILNAIKNGKEIPKNVIDEHPEISAYLLKSQKTIPEFKTIDEATSWFKEKYPNTKLNLKDININIVNETLDQFHKLAQQFPDAAKLIKNIDIASDADKKYGQRYATSNRETGDLKFDPEHYKEFPEEFQEKIDKSVENGYHPRGSNNYGFVITHEFGHFLEWSMRGDKSKSDQMMSFIYKENTPDAKLSGYSLVDIPLNPNPSNDGASEWFAEAFASMYYTPPEYQHPLTKKVKEKLEKVTDKKIQTRWG